MNDSCVREKTVKEYIFDLGRGELCHDYEAETKRIIALLEAKENEENERHYQRIRSLEAELNLKDTIIRCLARCVDWAEG